MPVINISVENKIAEADGTLYVCGNSDFVAKFAFDAEWEAYENKTARFCYNNSYVDVVFTGNECPVPIISGTYFFNIGVYAGNLHTTTPARVPCKKSILCDTGFPADPPNDVYNQIMEKLNSLGSADPEAIAKAVADYLAAHPIEETDPTVPEWAKAETKPTYTADEVGAISQDDLQTATNDALAQAKASGEFDGPAGAPGKDGAGMDITGATVGQIAKIAAVDASGAPTAWAPVDMPSGGGGETWELINEVTLSEDAMAVVFDKDKNGAAFALRKFVVAGTTKGSNASNTGGGTICINVANTADDRYSIVPPTPGHGALKGDQLRFWHAAAENLAENGWCWYLTGADNTWKTNQVIIGTKLMGGSQAIQKVATYLALWSRTSGDAFAAGSKIELYGVRA